MYLGFCRWLMAASACVTLAACSSTPTSPSGASSGPLISQGPLAGLLPQGPPPLPGRLASPPVNAIGATRFLAFGDSITAGTLSSFDGSFLYDAPAWSYSERLLAGLRTYHPGEPGQPPRAYTVVNAGIPGEAAANINGIPGGENRIQREITTHRPQILLLLQGINDLGGAGRSPLDTARAVERIVNTARANNVTVLVATMMQTYESCHPDTKVCRNNAKDLIRPFNEELVRRLSGRQNVYIVDLYGPFGTNHVNIGGDGLHPNEQGYHIMATAFFTRIEQVLAIRGSFQ